MAESPKTVLIRCKQVRKGGSKHELFGKEYHFKPADATDLERADAPHVCAIPADDSAVIYRLLSLKESFELVDPDAELPPRPQAVAGQTIGNEKTAAAPRAPVLIKNAAGAEIDLTALAADELRVLAKDEFKIKVHHKWADDKVITAILEAIRGED